MSSENLMRKYTAIASVVSAYWFVSITMVFLNKYLLSSEDLKLEAPLFITWYQCVVTVGICWFFGWLSTNVPETFGGLFPAFQIRLDIARSILPLSFAFVGMIAFNNLCLKYVGVSFYNVGRSLTTVCNVILTYLLLSERTSVRALGACALIILGFLVGVDQEGSSGDLNWLGVFYGISASTCVALNSIFVKKFLPIVERNEWKLTLYNNFNACIIFLVAIVLSGEIPIIMDFEGLYNTRFWFYMTLAGVFGVAIGIVTTLQIKYTSPLTHNVSGTAKACAQTAMATRYYGEVKTGTWWFSNFLVLGGSLLYTLIKRSEMEAAEAERKRQASQGGLINETREGQR
eukprot:TRINITY_DN2161_c0_g2_i1.p1 TRINITY_DN2161_c0_g2~~TRINITY_DN2161_c0_g2_i1.p1  ORF type:complete len:345 (-),score=69.55 TRINITY_DN2161_c0_g2_i1:560-1594(-)